MMNLILRHIEWDEMLKMQSALGGEPLKGIPEFYSVSSEGQCLVYPNPWIYEGLK